MKLYRTTSGHVAEEHERFYLPETERGTLEPWESSTTRDDLHGTFSARSRMETGLKAHAGAA